MRRTLFILALVACHSTTPPAPPVRADASAPNPDACEAACANLARLGCPEAKPATNGQSCVELCASLEVSGHFSAHAQCIANALDETSVHACNVRCQR